MPGKKKATGMSRRESFLDAAVIAENKSIMRYNDALEDEARGIVRSREPDRAERSGGAGRGRPQRRDGAPRVERKEGPRGEHRQGPPRAPRGPVVSAEEEARLRDAVITAAGETGLETAGFVLVADLVVHARFDKASEAGWVAAMGGHPDERTAEEWELLRAAWQRIRLATLTVWVQGHPSAAPLLEREQKEAVRAEKAKKDADRLRRTRAEQRRRPRRGPRPGPPPGAVAPAQGSPADAQPSAEAPSVEGEAATGAETPALFDAPLATGPVLSAAEDDPQPVAPAEEEPPTLFDAVESPPEPAADAVGESPRI